MSAIRGGSPFLSRLSASAAHPQQTTQRVRVYPVFATDQVLLRVREEEDRRQRGRNVVACAVLEEAHRRRHWLPVKVKASHDDVGSVVTTVRMTASFSAKLVSSPSHTSSKSRHKGCRGARQINTSTSNTYMMSTQKTSFPGSLRSRFMHLLTISSSLIFTSL